jgi:hypothetical protein
VAQRTVARSFNLAFRHPNDRVDSDQLALNGKREKRSPSFWPKVLTGYSKLLRNSARLLNCSQALASLSPLKIARFDAPNKKLDEPKRNSAQEI